VEQGKVRSLTGEPGRGLIFAQRTVVNWTDVLTAPQ
jgi:hypothetical protein